MITSFRRYIVAHKIVSVAVVIVALGGGYFWYANTGSPAAVTRYVLQKATQGTVVAAVAGSGQVAPVNQVNVKAENTETVVNILVGVGDHVKAGQALIQLDTTNEAKALQQADISLRSAELSLAKLTAPAVTSTLAQTQDAVTQAEQAEITASSTLEKDYQSGFDTLTTTFVDFQNVMLGLEQFALGNEVNRNQSNPDAYVNLMPNYLQPATLPYRNDLQARFDAASAAYTASLAAYHSADRNSGQVALDAVFSQTYATAKTVSDAVKSAKDLLNYVVNNFPSASSTNPLPAITNTFQTNLGNYTNTVSGDVASMAGVENTVAADKNNFANAALSLREKQDSLQELLAGPNAFDVQSQQLSIEQAQLAKQTAAQNLANDTVRAPIAGVVSAIPSVVGETVAAPALTVVGEGEVAQITLNEIDAAKVSVGDKATLAFDALSGLSLAGSVVEIDPVGTVSQGVVNYNVKVAFVDPSARVKAGMSVTANIVTDIKADVIAVPNAAVVTQGGSSFVLAPVGTVSDADIAASASGGIILAGTPQRVPVVTGLANDTVTEIVSGVNAGDTIVVQTIKSSGSSANTAVSPSALRLGGGILGGGGGGGFGGGVRVGTGGATGR